MNVIMFVTLIHYMILQCRFAAGVGAAVPAYSWLARLRALQRAKEIEFQEHDVRKDVVQSKLAKRDQPTNLHNEGDIMHCIDEFAREFERKWHMDPKRGIKKNKDALSEEDIWNRLPRSGEKLQRRQDGSNSASEKKASDDVASLENITKMLSFSDDTSAKHSKLAKKDGKSQIHSNLKTREDIKVPLKAKGLMDNNAENEDLVNKNQQSFAEEVQDQSFKNEDENEKGGKLSDDASGKKRTRVVDESKNEITHDDIKRVMNELEDDTEKRDTASKAQSAHLVSSAMARSKTFISPSSQSRSDSFLESNLRDPPRYIIKVDGEGYITSENERYMEKLTDDRVNSELLLNLNELRQEQQSPKVKSLEDNVRSKREYKQSGDYNLEGRQNKDYIKQLEDSFPRDQGDYRDQVMKELKEHVRVKRLPFV